MTTQNSSNLPESTDVLIVGAGAAGLYCAWRLLNEGKADTVAIVERLNRIGGRLDTDLIKIKGTDGRTEVVRDEEGGMRFNYGMDELMALNGTLGLCDQIIPFPMKPDGTNYNRYYLRGHAFTKKLSEDDPGQWSDLYDLAPNERGKSPGTIMNEAYIAVQKANPDQQWPLHPTPTDWQRFRLDFKWKGEPLNRWQLWGLLRDMGYTEECVTMLSHALAGFEGPFLSLENAGEAFQLLEDFPKDPTYYTFHDGYSTLTNKLCEEIEKIGGGKIFLGVNVEKITSCDDGIDLDVTVAPPGQSSSRFVEGGVTKQIHANRVILAIASKALTDLYPVSPVFRDAPNAEQIWNDFHSVVNMRLLKINLYFREAWWEDESIVNPKVVFGPSFTDLPINSIYPFYSLTRTGVSTDEELAAALTIYCDFNSTNFWQGLQNVGRKFDSLKQREHNTPPHVIFPASVPVVEEAIKQIKLLFSTDEVPQPVMTSYRLWSGESDFGYAYHQWALNADDRGIIERLVEPANGIYTCNEAFSDDQGWVNGSLRSANLVLAKFGIEPLPASSRCTPPGE